MPSFLDIRKNNNYNKENSYLKVKTKKKCNTISPVHYVRHTLAIHLSNTLPSDLQLYDIPLS